MTASKFRRHLSEAFVLGVALAFLTAGTALAGTFAQAIDTFSLHVGPGAKYATISTIDEGMELNVERCTNRWCLIQQKGHRGWASIDHVSFGLKPVAKHFTGPKLNRIHGGSGTICFHTGTNFTGEAVCSKTGMVVPDLALFGYDNTFASISVEGAISANVCSRFKFNAYCETISKDQPRLNRHLQNAVSSYRVW